MTGVADDGPEPPEIKAFLKRKPTMTERQKALIELLDSIIRDDAERFKRIFDMAYPFEPQPRDRNKT